MHKGDIMTDKKFKLFLSMVSGEIYQVEEDEVKNLDDQQIPLLDRPNPNCKKCYGRGHIGYNTIFKVYEPCRKCGKKIFDREAIRQKMTDITSKLTIQAPHV
jgi:hypothetical protein